MNRAFMRPRTESISRIWLGEPISVSCWILVLPLFLSFALTPSGVRGQVSQVEHIVVIGVDGLSPVLDQIFAEGVFGIGGPIFIPE